MKKQVYFVLSCAISIMVALGTMSQANLVFETLSSVFKGPYVLYVTSTMTVITSFMILILALKNKIVTNKAMTAFILVINIFSSFNIIIMLLDVIGLIVLGLSKPNEEEKIELEKTNIKNIKKLDIMQRDLKGYILSAILCLGYAAIHITASFFEIPRTIAIIINIGMMVVFVPLSFLAFGKTYKRDFKELKENFGAYRRHIFNSYMLLLLIYYIITFAVMAILGVKQTENQAQLNAMPLWFTTPLALIYAPIVEEAIFRGSLRRFVKNKFIFIALSTIIFGYIHVTDEPSFKFMILHMLPYSFIGFMLAKTYTKTNNIFVSMSIHFLHNLLGAVAMIITTGIITQLYLI